MRAVRLPNEGYTVKRNRLETMEVQKAARFLDRTWPGWEDKVNLQDMHLDDPVTCILAQIFGNYAIGNRLLYEQGWRPTKPEMYPFVGSLSGNFEAIWVEEIRKRHGKAVVV